MRDRQVELAQLFDASARKAALMLVSDDLIDEHAACPRGPHSSNLHKILRYMRRAPLPRIYVIVTSIPWLEYRIGILRPLQSDQSRLSPKLFDYKVYATEETAMHAVFLQRIADLREVEMNKSKDGVIK